MKTLKSLSLSLVIALSVLTITSCSDDDNNTASTADYSELQLGLEINKSESALVELVVSAYELQQLTETGRISAPTEGLPNCASINVLSQQNFREITLDFGNNNCSFNGRTVQGRLSFSYTRNADLSMVLITTQTDGFYVDGVLIQGSRTILRELNTNGIPRLTHTFNVTYTFPNGRVAQSEGVATRTWVEGFSTVSVEDNVFEIDGNWKITFGNGNIHFYEVSTALRREMSCPHFVSGDLLVTHPNYEGILDFGDGQCDAIALFILESGETVEISLN